MANNTFEANIYTPDWTLIAVLTDYISIVWTDRYYDEGDFELILPLTKENMDIYTPDNYIICNQSDKVMIIEKVVTSTSAEGYKMKVSGRSAESLLRRRVTVDELIINRNSTDVKDIPVIDTETGFVKHSHFAGALATAFENCFDKSTVKTMTEWNNDNAITGNSEDRRMQAIRFEGVISDPFGHIANAIGNISSFGDEYYEIIQSMCEAKDIGFGLYRNFDRKVDINETYLDKANTYGLFDLVLYDGWNRTGAYLNKKGYDMDVVIDNKKYQFPSGVIFSVEFFNLQSSDAQYSNQEYKNYVFIKGDEIQEGSQASVDIVEKTANFTKAYTDEDAKYYLTGVYSDYRYGIFKRELFIEPGLSRGLNTRKKYADRLKSKGSKELKDRKPKIILSCEITNTNQYIYRKDYYLGDLVRVKDSMNNFGTFRVTEEIISCDSSGLKVYPTLEVYDENKYVEDDSLELGSDNYFAIAIKWNFNGGKMPATQETASWVFGEIASKFYNTNGDTYTTPKYVIEGNGAVKGLGDLDDGTIIDTIPSIDRLLNPIYLRPGTDTLKYISDNLTGVITYQKTEDFIAFPSKIGTVNDEESGDYTIAKEYYDLIYWMSSRKFVPHVESIGPETGIIPYTTGTEEFQANWFATSYRITFEHGNGGHYKSWSFGYSYCKIDEYYDSAPDFNKKAWYERKKNLYGSNAYTYIQLRSRPTNWGDESGQSSGSYKNYYMKTSEEVLDKVILDVPYNTMPSPPSVYADNGYEASKPLWSPEIVRATQDATYTAQWKKEDEDEDEEEEDEGEDWDKEDDDDHTNAPVKNRQGTIRDEVYIGDENEDELGSNAVSMVTFRANASRLFDDFKLNVSSIPWKMYKEKDGPDQHSAFYYTRAIGQDIEGGGSTAYFHAFWGGANRWGEAISPYAQNSMVGLSIIRNDGGVIWSYAWPFNSRDKTSWGNFGSGRCCGEVAFTNSPVVQKVMGYKMLTSNPIPEGSDSWPQNKIYKRTRHESYHGPYYTFDVQNSKPADWDTNNGWRNYCKKGQVGANYGFTCQGYDDLGILFNPIWFRLGIIDHPVVPFVSGSIPYDLTYTNNALQIANYKNFEQASHNYNNTGWHWEYVADAKWKCPVNSTITGNPEFYCAWKSDGSGGALFQHYDGSSWQDVTVMPDNWGGENFDWSAYRYSNTFRPGTSLNARIYGPATGGNPGISYYIGASASGLHVPIPKKAGNDFSIMVSIKGYTHALNVKPGTIATFKVNASSVTPGASMSYKWKIKYSGQTEWSSIEASGSSCSILADQSKSGSILICEVTASCTVFGETLSGTETTGEMTLTVSADGSDGKEPSDYDKKTEEKKDNTNKKESRDPQSQYLVPLSVGSGSSGFATFEFTGSGSPPDTTGWGYVEFSASEDFTQTNYTKYDTPTNQHTWKDPPVTNKNSEPATMSGGGTVKPTGDVTKPSDNVSKAENWAANNTGSGKLSDEEVKKGTKIGNDLIDDYVKAQNEEKRKYGDIGAAVAPELGN